MEDVVALFPRLGERMSQDAATLSGGEQQMLAIGRGLMARPALLLLDEPSLGIAPVLVQQIFAAIARIAEAGMTVLVVEQNTRIALATSQRAYVLQTGEVTISGQSSVLAKDAEIQRVYLGHPERCGASQARWRRVRRRYFAKTHHVQDRRPGALARERVPPRRVDRLQRSARGRQVLHLGREGVHRRHDELVDRRLLRERGGEHGVERTTAAPDRVVQRDRERGRRLRGA